MNRALTVVTAVLAAGLLTANGQVNVVSDVINFRTNTSGDRDKISLHYGNIEVRGNGNATNSSVIYAYNGSGVAATRYAVYGYSWPANGYGRGGFFQGGELGVYGKGYSDGTGSRYGGMFEANGAGTGPKYGVYSVASGGGTKWSGYFTGASIYVNGTTYPSDQRFKKNVESVSAAVQTLMQLQPRQYYYDTTAYKDMGFSAKKQYGLVAQEVETVLPEIVCDVPMPETMQDPKTAGTETFKGIDYVTLIPLLVAAVQEQQKQIEELKALVAQK